MLTSSSDERNRRESSETIRGAPSLKRKDEEMVHAHGDMWSP